MAQGPVPQQYYFPGFFPYYNAPPMFFGPPSSGSDYNPGTWYSYYPPPLSSSSSKPGISRASILTPAIVASVALLGSAILLVSYYKIFAKYCTAWQQLLGISSRNNNDGGSRFESEQQQHLEQQGGWFLAMNSGLDESIVRRIPIYVYRSGDGIASSQECVVCLGEFEEEDELRILPKCSHAFHVGCIDVWLRSHSNCPLCRAPVVSSQPPPVIQSIEGRGTEGHELDSQGHQEEHVISLQIEDDEAGRNSNPDPCNVENNMMALQRSSSMRVVDEFRRKSWRWRMVPLRRSNSTGSHHLVSYQDLVIADYNCDQTLASPASNLIVAPHNSAELDKQLSDVNEGDGGGDDGYVVLNIEIASTSSSSQQEVIETGSSSSSRSPSRLSVRRSLFKASSLKRSISSGSRVFSFRRFARSRSVA